MTLSQQLNCCDLDVRTFGTKDVADNSTFAAVRREEGDRQDSLTTLCAWNRGVHAACHGPKKTVEVVLCSSFAKVLCAGGGNE